MLKQAMACAALLFIVLSSNAQFDEIKIKYGPEINARSTVSQLLGEVDGTIIYSGYKVGKWCVGGVNAETLAIEYETPIDIPEYNGKEVSPHSKYVIDDELIFFYTYYDKKADMNYLFAQRYTAKGKPIGNFQKLKETSAESKRNKGSYSVSVKC